MANPIILVASLLLLAAALAGCAGGEGEDAEEQSLSTQTNAGNTTVSASVSAGPDGAAGAGSVNGTGNASAATSWSYDNRTGTLSGNGIPIAGRPIEKEESFTVPGNTSTLFLNLSADGEELTLLVRAPGCDDNDCAEETTTQAGKASVRLSDPAGGPYVAVLQLEGTGPVESDYVLEIATQGPGSSS